MRIVALASGGLDSSVMCALLKREKHQIVPIFVNYGQLSERREWRACSTVMRGLNLPRPVRINVQGYGKAFESSLTHRKGRIFEDAFLPGRNLFFLLLAAAYAHQHDCSGIAIGLLSPRQHIFGDQTKAFLTKAKTVLSAAMSGEIQVLAPLIKLRKSQVLALSGELKVSATYSCHSGKGKACGICISCREFLAEGLQP